MLPDSREQAVVEQPILWVGMSGFSTHQRAALEAALVRGDGVPRWRTCAFGDADAWWVNGAKARLMPGGNLRVAAGLPTEQVLNLDPSAVDRPVAFALPLAANDFEPRCTFDPTSVASRHGALLQFEQWLWLARAQFVLGAQVIHRGAALHKGIFHLSHGGRLLAVLDFLHGKGAIAPLVTASDLWQAQWLRRPVGGHDLPPKFAQTTPAQLAWAYVRRSDRDLLPPRYRTEKIFYRHVPGVPMRWLRDSQLMLLRELSAEPGTVHALRQRTGLPVARIEHDLACLYYANAITTTHSKAAVPAGAPRGALPSSGPVLNSLLRDDAHAHARPRHDLTAPALLEHRRTPAPRDSV